MQRIKKTTTSTTSFIDWLNLHRWKLLTIFGIYQIAILSIGIVNFPYIDDVDRQIKGYTGFAATYSRWGSEIASWIVQGSRHLTDTGLTNFILSGIILAIASIVAVYCINDGNLDWLPLISSTIIGLNPWFLECLAFRFDNPYMSLSILFSFIPFLWWREDKRKFFISSVLCIFLVCNTYQTSSGIFIVMVLCLSLLSIQSGKKEIISIVSHAAVSAIAYSIGMVLFLVETKIYPSLVSSDLGIAPISELPKTIMRNYFDYFQTLIAQSAKIWIFYFILLFIVFIYYIFYTSKISSIRTLFYLLLYLILGSALSAGVYIAFATPYLTITSRYSYGFAVFVAINLIAITKNTSFKLFNIVTKVLTLFFVYYILSFTFTFSSTLSAQKEAFERQSIVLASDLKSVVTPERKHIYMNTLFKDSPVRTNAVQNYPILNNLVRGNNELNWTNIILLSSYVNIDLQIETYDFNNLDISDKKLETTNYYYDIYSKDNDLYIYMK